MSKVTINTHQNKQYKFDCCGQENILNAGLKFGIDLQYDCNNGTCGACIAQVLEGKTQKNAHYDYVLSQQEIANKMILMCCHKPITDLIIKAKTQHEIATIASHKIQTKVKHIEIIREKIAILTLKMSRSSVLQYFSGQEAVLAFGQKHSISYPIASCPCMRTELEFHIRFNEKNDFSRALFSHQIKKGVNISVTGPKGIFRLKEDVMSSVAFIAWDIGFPPIRAIIEHHYSLGQDVDVDFYWGYPAKEQSPYLDKYARSWQSLFNQYTYTAIACASEKSLAKTLFEALNIEKLKTQTIYLAVPAMIVITLSEMLIKADISPSQFSIFPI